jgi:RNA-directed DNA polymerase
MIDKQKSQNQRPETPAEIQRRERQRVLEELWDKIKKAGGPKAYIEEQLKARGHLVIRRPTDKMTKAALEDYKQSLKRESASRRELRKEAWAAWRATHIVHLGDNVYFNDADNFDRFDLSDPDARIQQNDLPRLDDPTQLAQALGITVPRLRWLAYHRDVATRTHYRPFTIPKRDGSPRQIWAPLPQLKAAQTWVLRNIVEHLPVHGSAHGFLPGRSIATNAEVHSDSKILIKVDLKDFFPTVSIRRVKGIFRKAGYREQVATLLSLICTEAPREVVESQGKTYYISLGPRCLPQGAPTSPALTNTLCLRLDRRLTGLAQKLGWRYSRYADDLTFSLPNNQDQPPRVATLLGLISRIVADEGFSVHPDKTRMARKGARQRVTGLIVNGPGKVRVPRNLKRQLRAAAHNLTTGKGLKPGESLSRLLGYAAYIHMTDPKLGQKLLAELKDARNI